VDYALRQNSLYRRECTTDLFTIPTILTASLATFYYNCQSIFYNAPSKRGRMCSSDRDCYFPCDFNTHQCRHTLAPCNTDSDCYVGECDYFEGICISNQTQWERMFMNCFVSNMPTDVLNFISLRNNMTASFRDTSYSEYVTIMLQNYSNPDCVSLSGVGMDSLKYRTHATIQSLIYEGSDESNCRCTQSIGVEQLCLDVLCDGKCFLCQQETFYC